MGRPRKVQGSQSHLSKKEHDGSARNYVALKNLSEAWVLHGVCDSKCLPFVKWPC